MPHFASLLLEPFVDPFIIFGGIVPGIFWGYKFARYSRVALFCPILLFVAFFTYQPDPFPESLMAVRIAMEIIAMGAWMFVAARYFQLLPILSSKNQGR